MVMGMVTMATVSRQVQVQEDSFPVCSATTDLCGQARGRRVTVWLTFQADAV